MSRAHDLVRLAAESMDRGEDPFHASFLSEHEVTLDEVYDLSETLAQAARLYLLLLKRPEWMAVLLVEQAVGRDAANVAENAIGLRRVAAELHDLGGRS